MNRMKGETKRLRKVLYKFCAKTKFIVECVQLIDCNICDTIDCLTGLMAQKEKSASDRDEPYNHRAEAAESKVIDSQLADVRQS